MRNTIRREKRQQLEQPVRGLKRIQAIDHGAVTRETRGIIHAMFWEGGEPPFVTYDG